MVHFSTTTALALAAFGATSALARNQLTFNLPSDASSVVDAVKHSVEGWVSEGVRKFDEITHEGLDFELIQHADFPQYKIRMREPEALCDSSVKQYSGYLDIANDAHIFFWFFESRNKPSTDPLVVWLNGGPGCSSSTGLLFELGPCSIANEGQNTTYNKHSWNEVANMIFIDSPVNVGYSYGGKTVNSSPDTAEDLYAFMQLFYAKFPKFQKNEFHVSGESYAGTYIPNIGSVFHKYNQAPPSSASVHIPLTSLFIGNGLTDAYTQFATVPDFACDPKGKYGQIFSDADCQSIEGKIPTCQRLTSYCYNNPSRFTCVPATISCWQVAGPIQQSGLNPYDVRRKCDREGKDGPLCYPQMQWIETYLNKPEVKKALGASSDRTFESCNMQLNQAFTFNGDVAHNTAALLPPLLEAGIRVGIYAGEADFMCNYIGNLAWMNVLDWSGKEDFNAAKNHSFVTKSGKKGGETRSVGKGAGTFTYLQVYDAGHMVPYDQPEVALDFFTKWVQNKPFA
ncbi:Alpha/Beta hydrolase protein [Leucosporidium creatinivorum]|uniref:Carboxypeptidase n=1 Tax=Leucosporidium creatinivorum TaxID=106004 RepID=A0A1Y2F7G7_9BASI|nr:Alpha/Beta hydrolase protein [Leucosporidium creatinivorum]